MMRHFDMKRYPRKRGKRFIHYFGGAIIQGGRLFEGGLLFKEIRYIEMCRSSMRFDTYDNNVLIYLPA